MKYDDLIDRLRISAEGVRSCDECDGECYGGDCIFKEAADAIEELSAHKDIARDIATIIENEKDMRVIANNPRWIPVDDELPKKAGEYLVFACDRFKNLGREHYIELCYWYGETWIMRPYMEGFAKITHWMPLPEPPKEGNENS